jgi:hypothetical protein
MQEIDRELSSQDRDFVSIRAAIEGVYAKKDDSKSLEAFASDKIGMGRPHHPDSLSHDHDHQCSSSKS